MGNMYDDAIYRWNVFVGCRWGCTYCSPSYQRQMKRQKPTVDKNGKVRGCQDCYDYKPHFHPERLDNKLPRTHGDQFIWCSSSSDLCFAPFYVIGKIIDKIKEYPDRTFFMQTKDPFWMLFFSFPSNVILDITLETNCLHNYYEISKAPRHYKRIVLFKKVKHIRKAITIEPILEFRLNPFIKEIREINPEIIYIGYDTKNCKLPEPTLKRTMDLIDGLERLEEQNIIGKVKRKLIRKAWYET